MPSPAALEGRSCTGASRWPTHGSNAVLTALSIISGSLGGYRTFRRMPRPFGSGAPMRRLQPQALPQPRHDGTRCARLWRHYAVSIEVTADAL
jgi:hypothetical protein